MASRPGVGGKVEIEAADDFVLSAQTRITGATFTGILRPTSNSGATPTIDQLIVEIYRVFPNDSNAGRTPEVNTRANSPSDLALDSRDSAAASQLTFTSTDLGSFTVGNSVLNGINKKPNQTTGGEGAVTGNEVQFNVLFTNPLLLPSGRYFFVPQVAVTNGEFYWASAPKPIAAPVDLQTWIRNDPLAPDWSRVGTDIVGGTPAPTFNGAFTLTGTTPEPSPAILVAVGALAIFAVVRRRRS